MDPWVKTRGRGIVINEARRTGSRQREAWGGGRCWLEWRTRREWEGGGGVYPPGGGVKGVGFDSRLGVWSR